jgi:hypothetical protein
MPRRSLLSPLLAPLLALLLCMGAGPVSSFTLVNRLPVAVRELFVTPAGDANWGRNRLDGRAGNPTSIAPGASFTLRRPADTNCIFDMRVRLADGKTEDRHGVNVCATETVAIGAAAPAPVTLDPATGKYSDDPSFKLFNRAARDITGLYATPSGLARWGQNRFADEALPPDHHRLVPLPRDGNCFYDLRVVFADKQTIEKKHTNLCAVTELPAP